MQSNWTSHNDAANKTPKSPVRLEKRGYENYFAGDSALLAHSRRDTVRPDPA